MKTTIACVHPKVVTTVTGERIVTPCGECEVCRNSGRSTMLQKLNAEIEKHRFVYFVTLTYADRFIPRICINQFSRYVGQESRSFLYDWKNFAYPVFPSFMKTLGDSSCVDYRYYLFGDFPESSELEARNNFGYKIPRDVLQPVFERLEPHSMPYVPVLNYRDVQLFLKRLRKRIHNFCKTNQLDSSHEFIKYHCVGEYGPEHFRPHYHLLLFADSKEVASTIVESVSESWTYGYSSTSLARGGSAAYVAGYLNSYAYLPRFYTDYCRFWRPFSKGSIGIGTPDEADLSEVDLFADERFDPTPVVSGTFTFQSSLRRSHFRKLYAGLSSFFNRSVQEFYGICCRISQVYRKYGYDYRKECFTGFKTLKIACSNYLAEVCESRWVNGIRYYLFDSDIYPVDSLVGYLSYQNSDGSELVRDDLAVNRLYTLSLRFRNFLKLFGYDLYDFTSVTFSKVSTFFFHIRKFVSRLGIGSLSSYFHNMENVAAECEIHGYSAAETADALSSYVRVYYGSALEPRSLEFDDSAGIYRFVYRRGSYVRAKLDELRDFFRSKIKHRELNDTILFNSKYLNQYGRSLFA